MNYLHVYSDEKSACFGFDHYDITEHYLCGTITSKNSLMKSINIENEDIVYFRTVKTMEDCHKLVGIQFKNVKFHGIFHSDLINWLLSRVRG